MKGLEQLQMILAKHKADRLVIENTNVDDYIYEKLQAYEQKLREEFEINKAKELEKKDIEIACLEDTVKQMEQYFVEETESDIEVEEIAPVEDYDFAKEYNGIPDFNPTPSCENETVNEDVNETVGVQVNPTNLGYEQR